jgi:micrococcal nuclease
MSQNVLNVNSWSTALLTATYSNTQPWTLAGWNGIARIVDVYDGDTMTAILEYPSNALHKFQVRLRGIDTPELRSPDPGRKSAAMAARDRVMSLLLDSSSAIPFRRRSDVRCALEAKPVLVQLSVAGLDKYGRLLGDVCLLSTGENIANVLEREGLAVAYTGGTKESGTA